MECFICEEETTTYTSYSYICRKCGITAFHKNKKFHNTEGPAIMHDSGVEEYWVDGKKIKN